MTPDVLLQFAIFAYVASATPGPNNVIMTATGAQVGVRRGLPAFFGIACGFAAMNFVLALSFGGLAAQIEAIRWPMRLAGMALLLWLTWKIATAPVETSDQETNGHGTGDYEREDHESAGGAQKPIMGFFAAALFQWVNPKAWMIVAGAISTYTNPEAEVVLQALTFAGVFLAAGLVGTLPWLVLGSVLRRWLKRPQFARSFNIIMALLLFGSVVPMVFEF